MVVFADLFRALFVWHVPQIWHRFKRTHRMDCDWNHIGVDLSGFDEAT